MVKNAIKFTPLMDSLPSSVPFVGPETQERFRSSKFLARLGANEKCIWPISRCHKSNAKRIKKYLDVWGS